MKPEAGAETLEQARRVTEFCLSRGAKLFADWPVKTLFAYVFFHLTDRTCFVCRSRGRITAVMFGWAMPESELRQRREKSEPLFTWRISRDQADAIFVAEVLAARKGRLPQLMTQATRRWPDWEGKKVYTCRRGRLHELNARRLMATAKSELSGHAGDGGL